MVPPELLYVCKMCFQPNEVCIGLQLHDWPQQGRDQHGLMGTHEILRSRTKGEMGLFVKATLGENDPYAIRGKNDSSLKKKQ